MYTNSFTASLIALLALGNVQSSYQVVREDSEPPDGLVPEDVLGNYNDTECELFRVDSSDNHIGFLFVIYDDAGPVSSVYYGNMGE